jgi:hypothetical protein
MQQPDRPSAGGVRVPRFRGCSSLAQPGQSAQIPQTRQRRRRRGRRLLLAGEQWSRRLLEAGSRDSEQAVWSRWRRRCLAPGAAVSRYRPGVAASRSTGYPLRSPCSAAEGGSGFRGDRRDPPARDRVPRGRRRRFPPQSLRAVATRPPHTPETTRGSEVDTQSRSKEQRARRRVRRLLLVPSDGPVALAATLYVSGAM